MKKLLILVEIIFLSVTIGYSQTITYVNINATGGANDGTSWANAYRDLSSIPTVTSPNYEIWVAAGTYRPTATNDQTGSFVIPANTTILGGFTGAETNANQRNWKTNPTIVSGDLNSSGNADAGDSHTLVSLLQDNVTIDGFIFENSFADDETDNTQVAIGRAGAAIYARNANNAIINNCIFHDNVAQGNGVDNGVGGAVINFGGDITITNSLFFNNTASGSGGAISGESGEVHLINCTVANNTATHGGGIHVFAATVMSNNTIFTNNSGTNGNINVGAAIPGQASAAYCLFFNNTTGNTGVIPPNVTDGTNNIISTDPIYNSINNTNGYVIDSYSPAANAGDNSANTQTKDLAANDRIDYSTIDIGAYEAANLCSTVGSIVYVNHAATGNNDGSTWADAFASLESALALQDCGFTDEIRVAGGTYVPSAARSTSLTNPRDFYFWVGNNIRLKGGYNPATGMQDQNTPSILSGDLGGDNTVHVLITTNLDATALIDGFTVRDGRAVFSLGSNTLGGQLIEYDHGGGWFNASSSPRVTNCIITNNTALHAGGGMYNRFSSPTITYVTFAKNDVPYSSGGGMYNYSSFPNLSNVVFSQNSCNNEGGGMYNSFSSPTLTNVVFSENVASSGAGGGLINFSNSNPILVNVTFSRNRGKNGGGMAGCLNCLPTLQNTLFFGNTASNFGFALNGRISASSANNASDHNDGGINASLDFVALSSDPFFNSINPVGSDGLWGTEDDGLRLIATNSAVDAGNSSHLPADNKDLDYDGNTSETIPFDIAGVDRIQGTEVNIGAYENVVNCAHPTNTILYVNTNVVGGANDGTSWADAFGKLEDAFTEARFCPNLQTVWVAQGTYKPGTLETDAFTVPEGITVLGGFNATETAMDQRNWANNITILSGDLDNSNSANIGDVHTIVSLLKNNSTLDGFIIENAYADGTESSPFVVGRTGAGVYNLGNNSISNCIFKSLSAVGDGSNGIGGAIVSFSGDVVITNSLFYDNEATSDGGAISIEVGTINLINSTLTNNNATNKGGGVHFFNGNLNATNTIFANNTATSNGNVNDDSPSGGGVGTLDFCLVFGGNVSSDITQTNGIAADPLFKNPATDDFTLQNSSPAINVGDNTANALTKDLAANDRVDNFIIDIGAYEAENTCSTVGRILYVDQLASGNNNGSSWTDAFSDLTDALTRVSACPNVEEIWVAQGTYKPGTLETNSFTIPEGITLFGGFYGTETDVEERNWASNTCILSGDLDNSNSATIGDAHTIVSLLNNNSTLDGFTIENAYADGTENSPFVVGRTGAGVYNAGNNSITNCIFKNLSAVGDGSNGIGGAIVSFSGDLAITNSLFYDNEASANGGGISIEGGTINLVNSTLTGNNATSEGGAVHFFNGNLNATNTIFSNNKAPTNGNINDATPNGGGVGNLDFCLVFDGEVATDVTQTNGVAADPLFVDATNGDYTVQANSPVINSGDNTANAETKDLAAKDRIDIYFIDIGAYEAENTCATARRIAYVDQVASGNNNGSSWVDAFSDLTDALAQARTCPQVVEIWVAQGTYKPGTIETSSFIVPEGVAVRGGFMGTETTYDERNWASNPTVLSGDLDNSNTANTGDAHTIVTLLEDNSTLDGFTIENSFADDETDNTQVAIGRAGAAIYARNANNAIINNCIFHDNVAQGNGVDNGVGGAVINFGGDITVTNSLFFNNAASGAGGAISGESGEVHLINCTVANNTATHGGGIHVFAATVMSNNTIFTNNSGTNGNINVGAAIPGQASAAYCLFFNNTTGNTGVIPPNVTDGTNNIISTDPIYNSINNTNGYVIDSYSPAANAGDNSANTQTKDLAANDRIDYSTIDIGAYEAANLCSTIGSIVYVNHAATGNNDGSTWADAFASLESALALQDCGFTDEIRVAGGTYVPSAARSTSLTNPREFYFWVGNNIRLKGGYNPATGMQDQNTPSILSGDLGGDNTVHVLITTNLEAAALIDGFTVRDGSAYFSSGSIILDDRLIEYRRGGGILNAYSFPTISNCLITDNRAVEGGGMYNNFAAPTLIDLSITGNLAKQGGGMANGNSSPTLTNVTFLGNYAYGGGGGGGMLNIFSSPRLTNVIFSNNSARINGGGILNFNNCNPILTNVTFFRNTASKEGGGMENFASAPTLFNTLFYGNTASVSGNAISGSRISYSSSHNASDHDDLNINAVASFVSLSSDPFINSSNPVGTDGIWATADDGLIPSAGSPLREAGHNLENNEAYDIAGQPRIHGSSIDIGAYEHICAPLPSDGLVSTNNQVREVQGSDSYYKTACNALITRIETSTPFGPTDARIWIESAVPLFNGTEPYVARHYEITPVVDAATATGRVTLYFTEAEFDAYNNHAASSDNLPTGSTDNAGKANVRITKVGGTTSDESGLRDSYSGTVEVIDPADADIVWNATEARWEISFNTTGFSGFFLHSTSSALPVELISFKAIKKGNDVELEWTTASEENNSHFEVEHSLDGINFSYLGQLTGSGTSQELHVYKYTHDDSPVGANYYRLKQLDFNGEFAYSRIEVVQIRSNAQPVAVFPNPTIDQLQVSNIKEGSPYTLFVYSASGALQFSESGNDATHQLDVSRLGNGMYFIVLEQAGQREQVRFIKQGK